MNIFKTFSLIIAIAFLSACSSSKSAQQTRERKVVDRGYDVVYDSEIPQSASTTRPNEKAPSNRSLADMIRSLPGVTMTAQGPIIGGIGSFGSNEPLFVINGTAVSANYSQVVAMINPNDVVSISVLKGSEAAIYGSRGGNGVILIRTK